MRTLEFPFEGFMPSMLAMMEIPAIHCHPAARINAGSRWRTGTVLSAIARELFAGKSSLLLIGFLHYRSGHRQNRMGTGGSFV